MFLPPYLMPLVLIGAAVAYTLWQQGRRKAAAASSTQTTLGAIAQRLGLQVVEGDPGLNLLYFDRPKLSYKRQLRLRGMRSGRLVEFVLADSAENTVDMGVYRETTYSWSCHLVVTTSAPFPDFEVLRRNPHPSLRPDRVFDPHRVSRSPTRNPALDEAFDVLSADERLGPAVAPAVQVFASQHYIHVLGRDHRILAPFTRFGLPYFAQAAEQYVLGLEAMACAFEGVAAPAQVPAGTRPMVTT